MRLKLKGKLVAEISANLEIDYGVPSYYYLKQSTLTEAVIPSISGNLTIKFDVEGEETGVFEMDVTAYDPSGREYVLFRGIIPPEGTTLPKPADINVKSVIISKASVKQGEEVTINATLENAGELSGNYTLVFSLDGVEKDSSTVTLEGGKTLSKTVKFSSSVEGVHTVKVGGESVVFEVEKSQTGISGYPFESVLIGVMLVIIILILRTRDHVRY
jgi:hypothetical protein